MGPRGRDWLLLAGSLAFVVMGALLGVAGRGGAAGSTCVLFFGSCAAIAAAEIVRERRAAGQDAERSLVARFEPEQVLRADRRGLAARLGAVA